MMGVGSAGRKEREGGEGKKREGELGDGLRTGRVNVMWVERVWKDGGACGISRFAKLPEQTDYTS